MKISDTIENFICELLRPTDSVELRRNELASHFNCVPSQINYVIQTRFTTERGYIVESRRGGGGHIKITRVHLGGGSIAEHMLANVGASVDIMTVESIVNTLYTNGIIGAESAKLIIAACSNNALSSISDGALKNKVRADIFKNILLLLI